LQEGGREAMRKRVFKLCRAIGSPSAFYTQPYGTLTKISRDARDVDGTKYSPTPNEKLHETPPLLAADASKNGGMSFVVEMNICK